MIYKELLNAYGVVQNMSGVERDIALARLDRLKKYILGGSYTTQRDLDLILENFMDDAKVVANARGVGTAAIYKERRLLNNSLEVKLGSDIVSKIQRGDEDVDEIMDLAEFSHSFTGIIIPEVSSLIKGTDVKTPTWDSLEACGDEIAFLKRNTMSAIQGEITFELKPQKLKYLLGLLEGVVGTPKDRGELIKLLTD